MTIKDVKPALALAIEAFSSDREGFKEVIRAVFQEVLEAEMTEALGASKCERSEARLGYRSGSYERDFITKFGKIELRIPQDRQGRFSTELFERYQRSDKALLAALAQMYVQGVSTRKGSGLLPPRQTATAERSRRSLSGILFRRLRSRRSSRRWTRSWTASCAGNWPNRLPI